jgi:glycine dehydrogenase
MSNEFLDRHIGPNQAEIDAMLSAIGCDSVEQVVARTVPESILFGNRMEVEEGLTERDSLALAKKLAGQNQLFSNFIGQGYYGTLMPTVIQRNILENPGWYTAYTPYQAEISQGRLEMLLTFQQMIMDLTGMDISNASLLDEPTAAAEAMMMAKRANKKNKSNRFLVDSNTHPQTITILQTRAKPIGIELVVEDIQNSDFSDCLHEDYTCKSDIFGFLCRIKQKCHTQNCRFFKFQLCESALINTPKLRSFSQFALIKSRVNLIRANFRPALISDLR